jgi:hypothetical protein
MIRDVLGERITDELLEEINLLYNQIKVIGWKEIRPWGEFFAVFKPPQLNIRHLEQRITTNFFHYRSNYILICAAVSSFQLLFSPTLLLSLVLVFSFCTYFLIIHKKSIIIGDLQIDATGKQICCLVLSIVLLAVTGTLERLIWTILYCLTICLLHMIFRPRSVTSKSDKLYEELKMNGFTWYGGGGNDAKIKEEIVDPENPVVRDEDFSNSHSSFANASSTAMRKRAPPAQNFK